MVAGIAVAIKVGNGSSGNLPVGRAGLLRQPAAFKVRNRKSLLWKSVGAWGLHGSSSRACSAPCMHRNRGQTHAKVTQVAPPALPRL